jgi:hypothetical protein
VGVLWHADMGPPTPYVTWGEFVMNKIKENPELAGKVIGMPPTVSAIPDLSMSSPTAGAGNPLALTVNGQHKSVGEQATKALRELFVSLPNNCSEAELSGFLAAQCHELGICQMDMERPVLSARVNVVKQFAFCKQQFLPVAPVFCRAEPKFTATAQPLSRLRSALTVVAVLSCGCPALSCGCCIQVSLRRWRFAMVSSTS